MFKNLILILSLSFYYSAWANEEHHSEAPKAAEAHEAHAEPTAKAHESAEVKAPAVEVKHEATAGKKEEKHAEHKREAGPINADKAMTFLKNGNKRFTLGRVRWDGASHKDRERLTKGQKPHAIVLSCSDSRVPPELLFDQKLGEIFVIRTAGQSLDFSAIASIEYAVAHLGTNLIVVMGHESCGAVKAALSTLKGGDAGSIWLNQLVKNIHPRLKRFTELTPTENVVVESWVNVEGTANELLEKSEIVRNLVESGDVKIQKSLYHLGSGEVEWR